MALGPRLRAALVRGCEILDLSGGAHMVVDPRGPRCECGQLGCWQALASQEALVARALQLGVAPGASALGARLVGGAQGVGPELVCQMAAAGDPVAREAVETTARHLGAGLANLAALFSPEAIMLATNPPAVASCLRRATEVAIKAGPAAALFANCVFLAPALGETAPLLGAAFHAQA